MCPKITHQICETEEFRPEEHPTCKERHCYFLLRRVERPIKNNRVTSKLIPGILQQEGKWGVRKLNSQVPMYISNQAAADGSFVAVATLTFAVHA